MKKLISALVVSLALFVLVKPSTLFAQITPQSNPSPTPFQTVKNSNMPLNTNADVPQNFHTYTQNVFLEILASAVCMVGGVDILSEDGRCLGVDPATKKIGYVEGGQGGLVALMGNMISSTYTLPASTGTFTGYLASNFGITKSTYAQDNPCEIQTTDPAEQQLLQEACIQYQAQRAKATQLGQGIGFQGLRPVLDIWRVFRNLTYMLFVLIFVIIGLGIMFRVNIDARAVMSIQNQIPKIIIGIILITFSYAIAGFLIDMMYLSIYLIVHIFDSQGLATVNDLTNPLRAAGATWGGGVDKIASPAAESVTSVVKSIFEGSFGGNVAKVVQTIMGTLLAEKAGGGIGALAGGLIGGIGGAFAGGQVITGAQTGATIGSLAGKLIGTAVGLAKGPSILQYVAGIIIYLVITIAILSALIRTWFSLIKAYVFILLDVIFAPLFIVAGLLPTSPGGGFGSWIRSLLGNLAAFPVVVTIFLIGATIHSRLSTDYAVGGFVPPLIGRPDDDVARNIGSLIGLGLILIMPESVNIAKGMFKSPDRKLAAAAGAAIGHGTGLITKPLKGIYEGYFGHNKDGTPKEGRRKVEEGVLRGLRFAFGGAGKRSVFKVNLGSGQKEERKPLGALINIGRRSKQDPGAEGQDSPSAGEPGGTSTDLPNKA